MRNNRVCTFVLIIILLLAQLYPVAAASASDQELQSEPSYISNGALAALAMLPQLQIQNQQNMSVNVTELNNLAKNNDTDTDLDGLYDSVEAVLGTDFNNNDSDFDQLNDYYEAINGLDPLELDSNGDGLGDYFEVTNVSLDLDNDGYTNVLDLDNDNDGVIDSLDMSPFTKSIMNDSFHFDIKTNGNPIYINFQLKPKNPDHLNLFMQSWDWPDDEEGTMKDLDKSTDDVQIIPMLELTVPSSGIYYKIIAKHSNKSLEVSNASQDDGANVQQYTYEGHDNQLWTLELVEDGKFRIIARHSDKVIEVNNASQDDRANVQQFTNKGNESQLWEFEPADNGYYKIISNHSGKVLEVSNTSQNDGANVYQNTSGNLDNQLWRLEPVVDGLPEQSVVEDYGIMINMNKALIPLSPNQEYGRNVAFQGRMLYPESSSLNISADANLVWLVTGKTDDELGGSIESKTTILAQYKEDFMLTGFSIEENYGSNVGLFYSEDINQTFLGSFVMSYEFLRNSTNQLSDMPDKLANRNLTMESQINSYRHTDGTLIGMAIEMLPKTLESFSEGRVIPIIAAVEESSTSRDMRELVSGSYIMESSYDLDLRDEPILTTRMLKMNWYNTTTNETLGVFDMLSEMDKLGQVNKLDSGTKENMSAYGFELNAGDITVIRFGDENTDFKIDEWNVLNTIFSFTALDNYFKNLKKYNFFEYSRLKSLTKFDIKTLKQLNVVGEFKAKTNLIEAFSYKMASKSFESKMAKTTKTYGNLLAKSTKFGKWAKYLEKCGPWIDLGLSVFEAISIINDEDGSGYGWSKGIMAGLLSFGAACLTTFLIGLIPLSATGIGLLIVIGIGILLLAIVIGLIFSWIISKIMDYFLNENPMTELGYQMVDTSVNIDDRDNNGLTEKDRIKLQSKMIGWINKTKHGSMYWVKKSDINLSFEVQVSDNSVYHYGTSQEIGNWSDTKEDKSRLFNLGAWVDPKKKINLEFKVSLKNDFKVWYKKCFHFLFIDECSEKEYKNSTTGDFITIYFDVLPGNISEFVKWSEITPQDPDGDSVSNDDEMKNGTFNWKWDTDGDGLSDKFEQDYGTIPNKPDSDGDGLNDGMEVRLGTDPWNKDTDNDKLSDFEEYIGWNVEFMFFNKEFTQHVSSNPLINDTDGDGLTDFNEFLKILNPRSQDTNGNGINDTEDLAFTPRGYISSVDLNGKGSNIKVNQSENITALINYSVIGKKENYTEDPCRTWIFITMDNSTLHQEIYNGTPDLGIDTQGSANFTFNSPNETDVFLLRYYQVWNCSGIIPPGEITPEQDRKVIGVIDTTNYPSREGWVNGGDDDDGDSLIDINEGIGWDIDITNSTGSYTIHVTSDPNTVDTDFDGLTDDKECYLATDINISSNPRSSDTDNDGLTDYVESVLNTSIISYDTDGDLLDDFIEISFGSNPKIKDTDNDGLNDYIEYNNSIRSSNPNKVDTDDDGLNDSQEWSFGSSLRLPDSDEDGLYDDQEYKFNTDPWNQDTDGDNVTDGDEIFFNTSPTEYDTDFDNVSDGDEIYWWTDPLSNDTDSDGLGDGVELYYGTDPLRSDSDGDRLNDSEDLDSFVKNVEHIVLLNDTNDGNAQFITDLAKYTNITLVSPDELMLNYTNAPYIVLVGRPDAGNGTVGNITHSILEDSMDVLTKMLESDYDRFAVRYGVWNETQTIIMLSLPYHSDHWNVLNNLKGMNVKMLPDSISINYPAPRDFFTIDSIDTIKKTDSMIWVNLEKTIIPHVELSSYNDSTTPFTLNYTTGLVQNEKTVGQYLEINVTEKDQKNTINLVNKSTIIMLYTASDLDRTGNGYADDIGDISESTLELYTFNESTGKWTKLSENMDPNFEAGVATTNIELYGTNYEGYVWANVSHLSLFGISGREKEELPSSDDGGLNIYPMFLAIPEVTFYKYIHLTADVEQLISIPNIPGIYELSVNNPQNIKLMLYLSKIKSLPSDVPEAPYNNYSYFELLFTKFKTNQKENPSTQIHFMVPKDWGADKDRITLMHYENGWNPVNTEIIREDGENYYLMAEVNSYSIFAIVQSPLEEGIPPLYNIPDDPIVDDPEPLIIPPIPDKSKLGLILSIFTLLIGLGVISYILKKRRT